VVYRASRGSWNPIKVYGLLAFLTFCLAVVLLNHNLFTTASAASEIDPAGTLCVYSISGHVLECRPNGSLLAAPVIVGPENVTSGTGVCRDNPQCVGRKYKGMGPIEPGKYRMNRDTREEGAERFRLEPIPPPPGWRVWLPGWMPGALRGGFLLGLGRVVSHGCIQVEKEDAKAGAQYKEMLRLLEAHLNARHELVVVP
jgi:hypothetical protein